MHVLRVEHAEDGLGPYHRGEDPLESRKMPCWSNDKHLPRDDEETSEYFPESIPLKDREFGFRSFQQLRLWFGRHPRDCKLLDHRGYNVVIYNVDRQHVSFAVAQCVFDRDKALRVGQFSILRLLDRKQLRRMARWQNTSSPGNPPPSEQMENLTKVISTPYQYGKVAQFGKPVIYFDLASPTSCSSDGTRQTNVTTQFRLPYEHPPVPTPEELGRRSRQELLWNIVPSPESSQGVLLRPVIRDVPHVAEPNSTS